MELNAQALDWIAQRKRFALLTLITIKGASPRPLGAQMLVSENRQICGQISSGCVEQNLIDLALDALTQTGDQKINLGQDGPYFDLKLPCGSSLTILCQTNPNPQLFLDARSAIEQRALHYLCFDGDELFYLRQPSEFTIAARHPTAQAVIVGRTGDTQVKLLQSLLSSVGIHILQQVEQIDPYTAFVSLWHNTDQELPELSAALQSPAFYIGCIGSQSSHNERVMQLKREGVAQHLIDRIYAPAGGSLISKTPEHVALAIAHELVVAYEQLCKPA